MYTVVKSSKESGTKKDTTISFIKKYKTKQGALNCARKKNEMKFNKLLGRFYFVYDQEKNNFLTP